MGIVNVNDDSFSGDGSLDITAEVEKAVRFCEEGAHYIDIGAESARTNREPIPIAEEVRRLVSFLEQLPAAIADRGMSMPLISINSWRPEVIREVMPLGVDLINDIGGLPGNDLRNAEIAVSHGASLLVMHTVGLPKIPHLQQQWSDVTRSIELFFEEKIRLCESVGLDTESIVLDPGIDFAKQRDDNLRVYRDLRRFRDRFDTRILLPISRKTVIGEVLDLPLPSERDGGTIACLTRGVTQGADIFRVHNVRAASQALSVLTSIDKR